MKSSYTSTSGVSKPQQSSNVDSYGKWLETFDWNWYCTFTTRYPLSLPASRRSMGRLFDTINKSSDEVKLFWVAEPFDAKDGYHIHALLEAKGLKEDGIKRAWQIVSKGRGGKEFNNTVVMRYEKGLGGNFYIGKYLERNNADYDLLLS